MSKCAMAIMDEILARESHQSQDSKIHKIRAAMEVQLYWAEKVTVSK
jgi:hypothetical protein